MRATQSAGGTSSHHHPGARAAGAGRVICPHSFRSAAGERHHRLNLRQRGLEDCRLEMPALRSAVVTSGKAQIRKGDGWVCSLLLLAHRPPLKQRRLWQMSLLPIPDGIPTWLISEAREVALFGYSVQAASGDATFPSDLLGFLVPTAKRLNIFGWSVVAA
jgi:hypothetical protein